MKVYRQVEGGSQPGLVAHPPLSCQLCGGKMGKVAYDARTRQGRWGWLCHACFGIYSVGLGIGKGQKYRLSDGPKEG